MSEARVRGEVYAWQESFVLEGEACAFVYSVIAYRIARPVSNHKM
jgi:hypothetical protein